MKIIGEKINGAIPKVAEAIEKRDSAFIANLAAQQEAAGAEYIDICAGTNPDEEYDALCWLIDVVQKNAQCPICIDSPDPKMLKKVFQKISLPGLINSISLEGSKCEILLPVLRENPEWGVVALCCDDSGIASSAEDKIRIALRLIEMAGEYGITPDRIHIDPLVLALPTVNSSAMDFCRAAGEIKRQYPDVNITAALSNISFGMPARGLVNRTFLAMAMLAGLDSVISDPLNRSVIETIFAANALLGRDRLCRNYNKAFRAGKIGAL